MTDSPECAPPDRVTRGWHWLCLGSYNYTPALWTGHMWRIDGGFAPAGRAAEFGYRYIGPAAPPQQVDPDVIAAISDDQRREVRDVELSHVAYNAACLRFRYTCIAVEDAENARDEERLECERLEKELGL